MEAEAVRIATIASHAAIAGTKKLQSPNQKVESVPPPSAFSE
jgi:hypothetical protein